MNILIIPSEAENLFGGWRKSVTFAIPCQDCFIHWYSN